MHLAPRRPAIRLTALQQIECIVQRSMRAPLPLMVLKEFVERPLIMCAVRRADLPSSLHIPPGRSVGRSAPPRPPAPRPDADARPPPSASAASFVLAGRPAQQQSARRGNPRRYTAAMKWLCCCHHRCRRRRRFTAKWTTTARLGVKLSGRVNSRCTTVQGVLDNLST